MSSGMCPDDAHARGKEMAVGVDDGGHVSYDCDAPTPTLFRSRNSSKPATPHSRPNPLWRRPPKGRSAPMKLPPLTDTIPARSRRATSTARSASPPQTYPARPYGVSLAIATASSSSSYGHDREHRPEDLLLCDGRAWVDVREQGGLEEVARAEIVAAAAPDDEPRAVGRASLDVALHARTLLVADQRPHEDVRIGRVADRHAGETFRRELDATVEVLVRDEQAARQDAALAGVEADERRRQRHDRLEVGVVEHDGRRLPSQLQEDPLHRARGRRHHLATGRGRPGKGDRVDTWIRRQCRRDVVRRRREHVEDAIREVGALDDEAPEVRSRPRRERRRLEHNRASRSERCSHLGEIQLHRGCSTG